MDWSTNVNYLKRDPVTVARQIDYVFRQLWGKVILSGDGIQQKWTYSNFKKCGFFYKMG